MILEIKNDVKKQNSNLIIGHGILFGAVFLQYFQQFFVFFIK
jgi:hypothetical protein